LSSRFDGISAFQFMRLETDDEPCVQRLLGERSVVVRHECQRNRKPIAQRKSDSTGKATRQVPGRPCKSLRTYEPRNAVTGVRLRTALRLAAKHSAHKIARTEVSANPCPIGRRYRGYGVAADARKWDVNVRAAHQRGAAKTEPVILESDVIDFICSP